MKLFAALLTVLCLFVCSTVPSLAQNGRRRPSRPVPVPTKTIAASTSFAPPQTTSLREAARQDSALAEWLYQEMEPMGATALGLGLGSDPDKNDAFGQQLLAYTTFKPEVIGSQDVIVHSPTAVATESETSIAINAAGTVLVAGYNDARGFNNLLQPNTNTLSLSGVAHSTDGGTTWSEVPVGAGGAGTLPTPTNGQVFGDPSVKYDPTRDIFVYASIYVRPSDALQGLCISTSNSDGSVWSAPIQITPSFVAGHAADKELIDINPVTGRILVSWTDFTPSAVIKSTFSDDLGVTWSAAATLATTSASVTTLQGAMPAFLPGTTNSNSTAYIAWSDVTSGTANIGMSRSIDGGATWSAAVDIDSSSFPIEDQILGVDRVAHFPSIAVDSTSGRVYVAYQRNNSVVCKL